MKNSHKIPPRRHIPSELESGKFEYKRDDYYDGLSKIKSLGYEFEDYLHYFPSFVGSMTLSRYFSMYESYKSTLGLSGHIADVGIFKGGSSFLFTKLMNIFEPNSLSQVHGFDWFEGNQPDSFEKNIIPGGGKESYSRIKQLVKAQKLENILKIHKLDLTKDLDKFFIKYPHLQFKLVFMDAGQYTVVKEALPYFWDRLNIGGHLILDQYNFDVAPGETKAVKEILPNVQIKTYPFTWMPTAYIVKA